MATVGLVVPAVVDIATHSFSLSLFLVDGAFYIFLILYFIFSKRVKATLVNDLSKHTGAYETDEFVIERRGWPFVRNMGIYFVVFSILGHWMEMGMCQLIIAGLVKGEYDPTNTLLWRDWLYPFPMEGMAVVLIALVLYPLFVWLKHRFKVPIAYGLSFLANALTCSIIEFTMGMICNADYHLWDYRDMFGNFMGQVCLQNAFAFGVAASVIAWFVYPMLERWIARMPRDIMNIVFVAVMVFGGIVFGLYIIEPPKAAMQAVEQTQQKTESIKNEGEEKSISSALEMEKEVNKVIVNRIQNSSEYTDEQKADYAKRLEEMNSELDALKEELKEES